MFVPQFFLIQNFLRVIGDKICEIVKIGNMVRKCVKVKKAKHVSTTVEMVEMPKAQNGTSLGTDLIGIRGIIARGSVVNGGCGIISAERRGP